MIDDLTKAEIILNGGCSECFALNGHKKKCSKNWHSGQSSYLAALGKRFFQGELKIISPRHRRPGKSMYYAVLKQQSENSTCEK